MSDYSAQEVIKFLDFASDRGLMKKTSVDSIKSACNNVFSVLDESDASDVSKLDLESIIQRYQNINSLKVRPETMQTYGQRVKYAVTEFLRYSENKSTWKPSGGQRSATSNQSSRTSKPTKKESGSPTITKPSPEEEALDASEITHRFPIRRNSFVTIKGIPYDVKRSEMSRLTNFLANLVAEPEEEEQMPLMLNAPLSER